MLDSTVLFVDDQEEILFLIKRMLKDEPYKVIFASSGKEALEIIKKNDIDVVVTDVLMPNMSGLELLEIIKETHPNIVRIILSGFSQIPTLLSAINHGKIFRYITKPWQVDEEAKEIISDALEYAKLLKSKNLKDDITMESFCEFLLKRKDVFLITLNDKIYFVHPKLSDKFNLNEAFDPGKSDEVTKVEEFIISENIKIFLFA